MITASAASSRWSVGFDRVLSGSLNLCVLAALITQSGLSSPGLPAGSGADGGAACQVALLRNGFTIQYSRYEVSGAATKLFLCADAGTGYMEIPSSQIDRFEPGQQTPIAVSASVPATGSGSVVPVKDGVKNLISSAAARHQIDPDFVASVVKAESGFNPAAVSSKGASGLMQLMPQTAAQLGVGDIFDPAANVEGGTKYLRQLLDRYEGDAAKALAAYNAGPQRVDQYGGVPPYRETVDYVARIIDDFNRRKAAQLARPPAPPPDNK
jgi:Transglycosylase SLT domain